MLYVVYFHIGETMKTLNQQNQAFQALSDPTRLRMVRTLKIAGKEICQCEFVDILETSPANVSRHAKVLLHAGLISERKEGKWIYYDLIERHSEILKVVVQGKDAVFAGDDKRLRERLSLRCRGKCLIGVQKKALKGGDRK